VRVLRRADVHSLCIVRGVSKGEQGLAMPHGLSGTLSSGDQWDTVCSGSRVAYSSLEQWQRGREHKGDPKIFHWCSLTPRIVHRA